MDPFARAPAGGSMETVNLQAQLEKRQKIIAELEMKVKDLEAALKDQRQHATSAAAPTNGSQAAAASKAPASKGAAGADEALKAKVAELERKNAELEHQYAAVALEVRERDARWQNALTNVKRRYSDRLQANTTASPAAPAVASPITTAPSPQPAVSVAPDPVWAQQIVALVSGLKQDISALTTRVDQISRASPVALPSQNAPTANAAAAVKAKPPVPDIAAEMERARAIAEGAEPPPRTKRPYVRREVAPVDDVSDQNSQATGVKKRGRKPNVVVPTTGVSTSSVLAGGDRLSDSTTPHLKSSRAEADKLRASRAQMLHGGDFDLIGTYLKTIAEAGDVPRHEFDAIARRLSRDADDIAAVKQVSSGSVLAQKMLFTLQKHATQWREQQRPDSARDVMMRALQPSAFQSSFVKLVLEEIDAYVMHLMDESRPQAKQITNSHIAFEAAACAALWIPSNEHQMISTKIYDMALQLAKGSRRMGRGGARLAELTRACVGILDGFSRSRDVRDAVNERRASLSGLAVHVTLADAVFNVCQHPHEVVADLEAHWTSLCRAFTWAQRVPSQIRDLFLLDRARAVCTTKASFEAGWDAAMALRLLFQHHADGVQLFYDCATAACAKKAVISQPVALLIATCSIDFGLQYQTTDLALAHYLSAVFKGEVEPTVRLAAAAALVSCCPQPTKVSDPFVEPFTCGVETIRYLFEKQKTVKSLEPLMNARLSKELVAKAFAFAALPKS